MVAVVVVGGGVWWVYRSTLVGGEGGAWTTVPTVVAEQGPDKVRPKAEGGLAVPDQDKLIYNQIGSDNAPPQVEKLCRRRKRRRRPRRP